MFKISNKFSAVSFKEEFIIKNWSINKLTVRLSVCLSVRSCLFIPLHVSLFDCVLTELLND